MNFSRCFGITANYIFPTSSILATADVTKVLTLEPIDDAEIPPHNSVFINELKISDFKQVLTKNNIQAEFSNGALWCANSTLAIRRVSKWILHKLFGQQFEMFILIHRLILENCALKDVYPRNITKFGTYSTTNMPSFEVFIKPAHKRV